MTDDEILAATELLFPGKGRIVIDHRDDGWIYYRLWEVETPPDEAWWYRRKPDDFVAAVRRAWAE